MSIQRLSDFVLGSGETLLNTFFEEAVAKLSDSVSDADLKKLIKATKNGVVNFEIPALWGHIIFSRMDRIFVMISMKDGITFAPPALLEGLNRRPWTPAVQQAADKLVIHNRTHVRTALEQQIRDSVEASKVKKEPKDDSSDEDISLFM